MKKIKKLLDSGNNMLAIREMISAVKISNNVISKSNDVLRRLLGQDKKEANNKIDDITPNVITHQGNNYMN